MPFPDETFSQKVEVVDYRDVWALEGAVFCEWIAEMVPTALTVDHIGSTSVPGLAAKDCLDVMVRVPPLTTNDLNTLIAAGFRERPEEWNRNEMLGNAVYPKRAFAPPAGARSMNIHVREACSPTARYSLLFRDFLRADENHRNTWAGFKARLAEADPDIYTYGQLKAAAQPLLMTLAEEWAARTDWRAQ